MTSWKKMMREVKTNKRTQSVPSRKNDEPATSRAETPRYSNNNDGEINASDTENEENRIQDNPFRPSDINELRTPFQPINTKNADLDETINEDRITEDYHSMLFCI